MTNFKTLQGITMVYNELFRIKYDELVSTDFFLIHDILV